MVTVFSELQSINRWTMNNNTFYPIFVILLFFICSCSNSGSDKKTGNKLNIPNEGFEFKLFQRSQIEIPSDSGNVYCFIDDITRGQTRLTLKSGSKVLIDQSIKNGDRIRFQMNHKSYQLTCLHLVNKLIGNDYGFFKIKGNTKNKATVTAKAKAKVIDETDQIELLLERIENSDIIFIRNGTEHTPKEAAEHLRSKWEQSKGQIKTLDGFIKNIASESSSSRVPYHVKLKNGTVVSAEEWYETQMKDEVNTN